MIHVITPFSRYENLNFYLNNLKDKNIIWHPIFHNNGNVERIIFNFENWVEPLYIKNNNIIPIEEPNVYKLNLFLENEIIINEDYYCFINDDDWVEDNFFDKIRNCNDDVIFCTMKRGDNIPNNGNTPHGTNTLIPYKGIGCGFIGLEQIIVKGKILKKYKFHFNHMFDGIFAEYLQERYENICYNKNIVAYFNYLEPGRWNKGEIKMRSLLERFESLKNERRDISEHLDTLYNYASKCDVVIEMGVNEGVSTTAFLLAKSKKFYCYDYIKQTTPLFKELENICINGNIEFNFIQADTRKIEIESCDLLFLDTLHVYEQVKEELRLHASKVRKYIILHDTESFKYKGIVSGTKGIWYAIEEFLNENTNWVIKEHFKNNNGLIVLERIDDRDYNKINKKYLLATSAFSNPELLEKCVMSWPESSKILGKLIFLDGKKANEIFSIRLANYCDHLLFAKGHLGASGSWNKILKFAFEENNYERVIIMGSDTEMKGGFWDKLINDLNEKNPDFSCCMGFNCFVINRKCYETVGLFDLNYYPVYFEDNDFSGRVRLAKDTILYDNCGDESLLNHFGSSTIRKNENFNKANGQTFPMNQKYHVDKWGCNIETPDNFVYKTPFNNPDMTIKDWVLDIEKYNYKKEIWYNKCYF